MKNNREGNELPQSGFHSAAKSIFLHLVPGIVITLLYIAFIPLVRAWGYPTILALFAAVLLGILFQLGYVLSYARKKNGTFSLKGVFPYSRKSPWWQYLLVTIAYVAWCVFCFLVLPKYYSQFLMETLFCWIPEWFIPNEGSNLTTTTLVLLLSLGFLSNLSGAVIEEFYFRGILLPKVSWMGNWAPLFTTFLFTIYHFDSIWQSGERFLSMLPLVLLVWWKKDLKMAIFPHCALNAISIVLFAMEIL